MRMNRKSERTIGKEIKDNHQQLSESEVVSKSQQIFYCQLEIKQLKKNYITQFVQIIGKRRAIHVFILEASFKRELIQQLK
jgi:hypothetical protein